MRKNWWKTQKSNFGNFAKASAIFTFLKTFLFELREQKKVEKRFYGHSSFRIADQSLKRAYRGINPYHVSKQFLKRAGAENLYQYGETPITTMDEIARACEIGPRDAVIEMGAGRGRAALFLAEYIGCKVIAYEQIPLFVEKMVPSQNLQMSARDMLTAPLEEATVVYLYGTMLEDETLIALCNRFSPRTKVITVSFPLSDYSAKYTICKTFIGQFPWGRTHVYLNCKQ